MQLVYDYNRNSTLPRRVFIVNTEETTRYETTSQQYEVTAPDVFQAQRLVRNIINRDNTIVTFWTVAIREVSRRYDGAVIVTSLMEDGITTWGGR